MYRAGGEGVGAKQGTELSPSSSRPWVLRAHTKKKPHFFDTSPLRSGSKAMYNSGSRVIGSGRDFEDPSTWPPSKFLLLSITSLCYYWYLMLVVCQTSVMNQAPTVVDAVQLHRKKAAALVPRPHSLNIVQHCGLLPSFRALFLSSWIQLVNTGARAGFFL